MDHGQLSMFADKWSSPKYAVKSLSVHLRLCSAHFLDLSSCKFFGEDLNL